MDKRKNNGGARPNSGRLKKDDVISLIETMDKIAVPSTVWEALYAKVLDNDVNAIKTWLQYRYGMPKQIIEQNSNVNMNNFNIKELFKIDTDKDTE